MLRMCEQIVLTTEMFLWSPNQRSTITRLPSLRISTNWWEKSRCRVPRGPVTVTRRFLTLTSTRKLKTNQEAKYLLQESLHGWSKELSSLFTILRGNRNSICTKPTTLKKSTVVTPLEYQEQSNSTNTHWSAMSLFDLCGVEEGDMTTKPYFFAYSVVTL